MNDFWNSFLIALKRFISSSKISILFCIIVAVLLTLSFQSVELVVDLLQSPTDIMLFWPLFLLLALVISHYPTYLYIKNQKDHGLDNEECRLNITWEKYSPFVLRKKDDDSRRWWFGLIKYTKRYTHEQKGNTIRPLHRAMKHLLGTVFISSFIYILLSSYETLICPGINSFNIFLGIVLGTVVYTTWLAWYTYKEYGTSKINGLRTTHRVLSAISIVLFIVVVCTSAIYGWHPVTFWSFLTLNTITLLNFPLFRFLRKHKDEDEDKDLRFWSFNSLTTLLSNPAKALNNDIKFLKLMFWGGVFTLVIFILSNIYSEWFSAIVIILCFLYTLYGVIIMPLKHKFYYAQRIERYSGEKTKKDRLATAFVVLTTFWPVILIAYALLTTGIRGAHLHTLDPIPEEVNDCMTEDEFRTTFAKSLNQNTEDSTIYFISAYGGGLTANLWTNHVLDALSRYKIDSSRSTNILKNTISISGVSGGGMGAGLYGSVHYKGNADEAYTRKIQDTLATDFIARDIAWLLGWDLIREFFSYGHIHEDRAKRSLKRYSRILDDSEMLSKTYCGYWKNIQGKGYFPMLITNTWGTNHFQGLAVSVKFSDFQSTFPGSVDILSSLKEENTSLNYLEALSTCNRFPMISPAAKIENHGTFVDGGYFENSGMLSQYKLYTYLRSNDDWDSIFRGRKVVFIQIMNGTSSYLNDQIALDSLSDLVFQTQTHSEVGAIITGKVELESNAFLANKLILNLAKDSNVCYVPIALPFPVTEEKLKSFTKAEALNRGALCKYVDYNNAIGSIRGSKSSLWETTFPTTSRLVVSQSKLYMRESIEHGLPFKQLDAYFAEEDLRLDSSAFQKQP